MHEEALGIPVAGPEGNPKSSAFTNFGCPVYSAGEANIVEMLLIEAHSAVLDWIQEVALAGDDYVNPEVSLVNIDDSDPGLDDWDLAAEAYEPLEEKQSPEKGVAKDVPIKHLGLSKELTVATDKIEAVQHRIKEEREKEKEGEMKNDVLAMLHSVEKMAAMTLDSTPADYEEENESD
jgi:hypothetical protein